MLNQKRTAGRARLRLLYVIPLTGGMLCASTLGFAKDYAFVDLYARKIPLVIPVVLQEPKQQPKQKTKEEKKKTYPIESVYDADTGNDRPVKLIVINGKISRAQNFSSVSGYDQVKELNSNEAVAKYGKGASKGALEFTGKNAGITIKFPPPRPVKKQQVPLAPPAPDQRAKKVTFPPPPPPAPPKPKAKSAAIKFEGKNKEEVRFEAVEDVEQVKVVNADMEGIKQVKTNANKDKNATTTFSYSFVAKPEKAVEKVKSDVKEIKLDYAEKDAKTELSIAIKKNISKEIEKAREAEANKKAE